MASHHCLDDCRRRMLQLWGSTKMYRLDFALETVKVNANNVVVIVYTVHISTATILVYFHIENSIQAKVI